MIFSPNFRTCFLKPFRLLKPELVDVLEDLSTGLARPAGVALLGVDVQPVGVGLVSLLFCDLVGCPGPEERY